MPQFLRGLSNEEIDACVSEPHHSTREFVFQETMFDIRDPKVSLDFYTRVIGMRLLNKMDLSELESSFYFLGYEKPENISSCKRKEGNWCFSERAVLELAHKWGTEHDPDFKGFGPYDSQPQGFGHIGIVVPDVDKACDRFELLGVKFVKKPNDGNMKGIAFIQDPDGYWIEISNSETLSGLASNANKIL